MATANRVMLAEGRNAGCGGSAGQVVQTYGRQQGPGGLADRLREHAALLFFISGVSDCRSTSRYLPFGLYRFSVLGALGGPRPSFASRSCCLRRSAYRSQIRRPGFGPDCWVPDGLLPCLPYILHL